MDYFYSTNQLFLIIESSDKLKVNMKGRLDMDIVRIGQRIKELRKTHRLTQADLARMLQLTHQSISKWERGESTPDILMVVELSRIFSVSTDYLLLGKAKQSGKNSEGSTGLKAKVIEELSHGELLALYSTDLVEDMNNRNRYILQNLGFITIGSHPEWTIEGKQLSDEFWYHCCDLILKAINENRSIKDVYLSVNRHVDIPEELFYRFIDDLLINGKISQMSHLL